MLTKGLLDERNTFLWNYLIQRHHIEIRRENRTDYLLYTKGDDSVIYVPETNPDPASFTHELLHVEFWVKEIYTASSLILIIQEKPVVAKFCSRKLLEHIANCLEHMKMLPVFLGMGYKAKAFLADYTVNKLTDEDLQMIKRHFRSSFFFRHYYHSYGIDRFIGKYFAARACPNGNFDYGTQLLKLKRISPSLYTILEHFTENWLQLDVQAANSSPNNYRLIVYDFITELEHWAKGKSIV